MELSKIINARESMVKLYKQDLPITIAYQVYGLVNAMDKQLVFYEEKRQYLLEKYCTQSDNGYKLKPETNDEFEKVFDELMTLEMPIDGVTLPILIPPHENIKLSGEDLVKLNGFIKIG